MPIHETERTSFELRQTDGRARHGVLSTRRGQIETPVFMPVGTIAAVKALTVDQLYALDPQIILCNTYHLMLRPGVELLDQMGGVHSFMSWDRPILSDSGGFQVFSLAEIRKVREEGVEFQSHIDGSRHFLSPETSVGIQCRMGVDIAMAFDECPPYGIDHAAAERSMEMTHRWAARSLEARGESITALFGIIQGGIYPDLRRRSVEAICALPFDGYAIGGLSVGESKEEMLEMIEATAPQMPEERPRYLMGVGTPADLLDGVAAGIDMFDCVMPTRNGRNGTIFTRDGKLNIRNAQYRADPRPLDEECACPTCQSISRAYLRHLFAAGEMAGPVYATIHNLFFYLDLMRGIRQSIASRRFRGFREEFLSRFNGSTAMAGAQNQ